MQTFDCSWAWSECHKYGDMKLILHTDPAQAQHAESMFLHGNDSVPGSPDYVVIDEDSDASAASQIQGQSVTVQYPPLHASTKHVLHSVIIGSVSSYFKGRLIGARDSDAITDAESACSSPSRESPRYRYQMVELVEPDQLLAAGEVVKCMYMHELPDSVQDLGHVLNILKVAERWDVKVCVSACHKALALLAPSLTLDDLDTICALPASLLSATGMALTKAVMCSKLLAVFGNVVDMFTSDALLQQWLRLPQPAVLLLLNSDRLMTDCENSVVMVLSWWLEGEVGRKCEGAELLELKAAVRYGMVSPTYVTQLLPLLPKLSISPLESLELVDVRSWEAKSAGRIPTELLTVPKSWLRPHRPQPADPTRHIVLTLDVPFAQLKEQLASAAAVQSLGAQPIPGLSVSQSFRGFHASLTFGSSDYGDLACTVNVCAQLPTCDSRMRLKYGLPCHLTFNILDAYPAAGQELADNAAVDMVVLGTGTECEVGEMVPGWPGSPLDMSWWRPFMRETLPRGDRLSTYVRLTATLHITPTVNYDYK